MEYQEALDFLYSQLPMYQRVGKAAMKPDLTNTLRLASSLKDPHHSFKSIHVAGTNGKGSTSHMLASILQSAGYKVGLYTSPHLKSFRERIRVNGELLNEDYVGRFVCTHMDLIKEVKPSFFEITVVMAFDYFREQAVDFAIIETGLGGRLDSTNIIKPVVSVITSIGLDHEDLLGYGFENIAKEKAGIIKPETPIVVGQLNQESLQVIEQVAESNNSTFINEFLNYQYDESDLMVKFQYFDKRYHFTSDLKGDSIRYNVPSVLETVKQLISKGVNIDDTSITDGINDVVKKTGLLGRWQIVKQRPLTICDIGHNEEAVKDLMIRIAAIGKGNKIHIVWGMAQDKSIDSILNLLLPYAKYYFCAADLPRAMNSELLKEKATQYALVGDAYQSVNEAYETALVNAQDQDLIFVGGSTFVVAEIKDI